MEIAKEPCTRCDKPLERGKVVLVDFKSRYHLACFVCVVCGSSFTNNYWELDDDTAAIRRICPLPPPSPLLVNLPPSLSLSLSSTSATLPSPLGSPRRRSVNLPPPLIPNPSGHNLPPPLPIGGSTSSSVLPPPPTSPRSLMKMPSLDDLRMKSMRSSLPPLAVDLSGLSALPAHATMELPPLPSPVSMKPRGPYCFEHYCDAADLKCAGCGEPITDVITKYVHHRSFCILT